MDHPRRATQPLTRPDDAVPEEMAWYIPLLIFVARIADVSIGTVRMILVVSGARYLSAALGAIEVIIWILAVGGAIKFLHNPYALAAYATGFATGVLVGMEIESRIALGFRVVRVINSNLAVSVTQHLRAQDFRVTRVEGSGRDGPVEIAFTVVRRRRLKAALAAVNQVAPNAFVTIERADRPVGGNLANPVEAPILRPERRLLFSLMRR